MAEPDVPSVQRTAPADAADEGYPIAADEHRSRKVAALARRAITHGSTGVADDDLFVLAERFLNRHPGGDQEAFLAWLASDRGLDST